MHTILCVDDHRGSLATLSMFLRGKGYRCITAETSGEADRRFVASPVDLVIIDHGLPDMDGLAIASRLKRIRPVLTLMLSGHTDVISRFAPIDLILSKPIEPDALIAAISQLLSNGEKERREA